MTWSPFFSVVTPTPTSTTTPEPSWPNMAGNSPSGSAPERVNSSVWHTPLALISTNTSKALGPSSCTVSMTKGLPASYDTAAFTSMVCSLRDLSAVQNTDVRARASALSMHGGGMRHTP